CRRRPGSPPAPAASGFSVGGSFATSRDLLISQGVQRLTEPDHGQGGDDREFVVTELPQGTHVRVIEGGPQVCECHQVVGVTIQQMATHPIGSRRDLLVLYGPM